MFRFLASLWYSFKEYLILLLIIAVSIFLMSRNDHPSARGLRGFSITVFAGVSSFVSGIFQTAPFQENVERLRQRNAELMVEVNKLRRQALNVPELQSAIHFKDTSKFTLIPATITYRSMNDGQYFFTASYSGTVPAKQGMPVVTDAGLAGIVSEVSGSYITIRTLKTLGMRLVVQEERTSEFGVLKWDGQRLIVTNVLKSADIKAGARFFTSTTSSIINVPLPVGRVKKNLNPGQGMMYSLEIEPFVNLNRVDFVYLIADRQGGGK